MKIWSFFNAFPYQLLNGSIKKKDQWNTLVWANEKFDLNLATIEWYALTCIHEYHYNASYTEIKM